jgi:RNA polymerase sigma-70 factor (ECF subfamily)
MTIASPGTGARSGPEPEPDPGTGPRPDEKPGTGVQAQPQFEELVRETLAGVPGARDRLLGELQPLVLRYCRGRIGHRESVMGSADDVAQEVCLAVVTALPGYQLKGLSFRAFVYGIAAHKVADAYRAMGRNRCDPVAEIPDAPAVHDGPEQQLLSQERLGRLTHLLDRLTPRQRDVLVLRVAVGLSAEETAVAVGSTPGAVRVTQHRALNRLRAEIGAADGYLLGLAPAPETAGDTDADIASDIASDTATGVDTDADTDAAPEPVARSRSSAATRPPATRSGVLTGRGELADTA